MAHEDHYALKFREIREELQTQKLELAYAKSQQQFDIICDAEAVRILRLELLMRAETNNDLEEQVAQDNERFAEMENSQEEMQSHFEAQAKESERLRGEVRSKNRDLDTLRAELSSLQTVSADSSILLTEKLTLSRELSALRPEVEHLRAQVLSNQALLSEKLSLQRQLSSVQVELEAEKRATQKAITREGGRHVEGTKIESQLHALQAEFAVEHRERQKLERDTNKAATDFESKKTVLESKLDEFRTKLRATKEQLKETQSALQRSRAAAAVPKPSTRAESVFPAIRNSKKRSIAQVDFDATSIGTPGDQPAAKREKRGSTLPGEKSTFSITPFLNRTANLVPDSSEAQLHGHSPANGTDAGEAVNPGDSPSTKPKKKKKTTTKVQKLPTALQDAKPTRPNARGLSAKAIIGIASMPSSLDQVAEEDEDEPEQEATLGTAGPEKDAFLKQPERLEFSRDSVEPTFIKKKRKILGGGSLGRTIFDQDDGEITKGSENGLLGGTKVVNEFRRKRPGLGAGNLGFKAAAGPVSVFGTFSPLKKDRKAGSSLLGA